MRERHESIDWRAAVRTRLAAARLLPQDEAEIVEELAQHLESAFTELAPSIGEAAAREQLMRELQSEELDAAMTRRRRRTAPSRSRTWSSGSLAQDFRFGARALRRTPATAIASIAALALGIAHTTVMFSVIYGLLIKGLPFRDAGQIATIYRADPTGNGQEDLSPLGDFVRYRAEQHAFATFGAFGSRAANVSGGDRAERVDAARVTAGMLDVTSVRPLLGRLFVRADEAPSAPPTAIIGYALWRDHFAGDSAVVGKTLRADGTPRTIIGVMPERFVFPATQQLWTAMTIDPSALNPGEGTPVTIVARLRTGTSYVSANAELAGLSRRLAAIDNDSLTPRTSAQPFIRARIPGRVYSLLYAMFGAVCIVLLLACANVANLLLDRAANRTREIGVRVALGASRLALVRQALVESAILAGVAAVVGAALAHFGIEIFNRALAQAAETVFWADVQLHPAVLAFVIGIAAIASLVAGVLPALHAARLDVSAILKDNAHIASSFRIGRVSRAIVVGEIALATVLLVAAAFMTTSIVQLRTFAPHFATDDIATAQVALATKDTALQRSFVERLEHELEVAQGGDGVYVGDGLPGVGWHGSGLAIEGETYARPRDYGTTRALAVSPGFFSTFAIALLRGRAFSAGDRADATPVVIVNEIFAARHFKDVDPIGKRIHLGQPGSERGGRWLTIVGVMPNIFGANPVNANATHFPPEVVTPLAQQTHWPSLAIALRGSPSVASAATVRAAVKSIDPELPVFAPSTMAAEIARPMWASHLFGSMFIVFGIASLLLAAIGLYAVMAFSISRRAREMGVRLALGATAGRVVRMICLEGAVQIVIGLAIGLALSGPIVRMMGMLLFGVEPGDPKILALVAVVLGVAGFAASFIPALAATRVDPVVALRSD